MQIGGYRLVIVGREDELEFGSTGRPPALGDEITLEGVTYRVVRVEHVEDSRPRTIVRYTYPRIYAKPTRRRNP